MLDDRWCHILLLMCPLETQHRHSLHSRQWSRVIIHLVYILQQLWVCSHFKVMKLLFVAFVCRVTHWIIFNSGPEEEPLVFYLAVISPICSRAPCRQAILPFFLSLSRPLWWYAQVMHSQEAATRLSHALSKLPGQPVLHLCFIVLVCPWQADLQLSSTFFFACMHTCHSFCIFIVFS